AMKNRRIRALGLVTMLIGGWPIASASAQDAGDGGAPTVPAMTSPLTDAGAQGDGASDAAPVTVAEPPPPVAPIPVPPPTVTAPPAPAKVVAQKKPKRVRPLQTTVGLAPTATDFGSEADVVSTSDEPFEPPRQNKWT